MDFLFIIISGLWLDQSCSFPDGKTTYFKISRQVKFEIKVLSYFFLTFSFCSFCFISAPSVAANVKFSSQVEKNIYIYADVHKTYIKPSVCIQLFHVTFINLNVFYKPTKSHQEYSNNFSVKNIFLHFI